VGFETTISAGERPQTYALDRAATGTGVYLIQTKYKFQSNTTIYYTKYSYGYCFYILYNKLLCSTEIYTLCELNFLAVVLAEQIRHYEIFIHKLNFTKPSGYSNISHLLIKNNYIILHGQIDLTNQFHEGNSTCIATFFFPHIQMVAIT
jgi:hypothetical protein